MVAGGPRPGHWEESHWSAKAAAAEFAIRMMQAERRGRAEVVGEECGCEGSPSAKDIASCTVDGLSGRGFKDAAGTDAGAFPTKATGKIVRT